MTSWPALLDAIDAGLQSVPPTFVDLDALGPELGPLPAPLAARAAATLRRMTQAEAALERSRAELGRELAALTALAATAPAAAAATVPHFLDTKA
jgi:hypothetical protein